MGGNNHEYAYGISGKNGPIYVGRKKDRLSIHLPEVMVKYLWARRAEGCYTDACYVVQG